MPLPTNPDGSLAEFTPAQIAAMGIETYKIEDGEHPTHRREFNASTISASYMVNYDQFENFVGFMMGGSALYTDSGGVLRLSRLMPQVWPANPTFGCVRIDMADGHQFLSDVNTGPFPVPSYTSYKVDLTFQDLPYRLRADYAPLASTNELRRYVQTLPSETTSDHITLPGGIMVLVTTGGAPPPGTISPPPLNHNIGIPIPTQIIRRKWLRLPYSAWGRNSILYSRVFGNPAANIQGFIGTVNNDADFLGYDPGQLLFLGVDEEEQLDPIGGRCWNLTYKFLTKGAGHNFYYFYPAAGGAGVAGSWNFASADGNYYSPVTLPDGKSIFNARQHQLLFAVGASL